MTDQQQHLEALGMLQQCLSELCQDQPDMLAGLCVFLHHPDNKSWWGSQGVSHISSSLTQVQSTSCRSTALSVMCCHGTQNTGGDSGAKPGLCCEFLLNFQSVGSIAGSLHANDIQPACCPNVLLTFAY